MNELLRITFSKPVRWLSGGDAAIRVGWVATSLENAQPGDLILIPAEDFTSEVIPKTEEKGVSALLLLGSEPVDIEKTSLKIAIGIMDEEEAIHTIQRKLINNIVDQRSSYMESGYRIHVRLAKLAAEGLPIDEFARTLLELSGRGVLIQDKRMNILADCPSINLQSIWDDITEQLGRIESLPSSLQDRNRAGQQSPTISQLISDGIARIVTPITVGEVARGYLSLIGTEGELDRFDQVIAEEGALVCAMEMARTKAVRETEKRLQGDLLTALLQEDLSPRDAGLWVQTMGLDQTQNHVAIQFAWDSPSPPSRRRLETIVNGEVVRLGARVIINPTGSNVICFCQTAPNDPRPTSALELGRNCLARAHLEYPEAHARCGIDSPVADLNQWQESFRESGQALAMAFRLEKDEPLYYPDLSIYRLLLLIEPHAEFEQFKEDILGSLLSYEGGRN
jgi:purine catabolism regulator